MSTPPRGSAWHPVLELLLREVEARATREPGAAALLLAASARIHVDALGEPLRAAQALARAAELAPGARFVASTARWIAEQGGDPGEVLARTRAEARVVADPQERAALFWRVAAIEEHVVGDPSAAMATLREILALAPGDVGAYDALGALYLRSRGGTLKDEWEEVRATEEVVYAGLADSASAIANATTDATLRSALEGIVGVVEDRWLGKRESAAAHLRRALDDDPDNAGAQAALEAILLRQGAWDEYARVVAAAAERTEDPATARDLWERAADVHAERGSDASRAAGAYVRAATIAETDPGPVEKLARLLEASGRWEDAAAAWERLLTRLRDPGQRAIALVRLGALREARLGRGDDALLAYRAAVQADPLSTAAVSSLLRLGRERRLPLAIELELRDADRIRDPAARAVRYAALAGFLLDGPEAGARDGAVALLERALALDPLNASAFATLDRSYRTGGAWPRLIALYESTLAATTDARRDRALRLELAELLHARAGEPVRAAALYREALAAPPDDFVTLGALARALADAGEWADHVDVLEAQTRLLDGDDEVAAIHHIGAVLESKVGDLDRALAAYEVVLDRAPRHEAAARALARIHERQGRWDEVIADERRLLGLATRDEDRALGLERIAAIAEERLGREAEAAAALGELLEIAPGFEPALAALERLLRRRGDLGRLVVALRRFGEVAQDPRARARAVLRAATLLELAQGDTAGASRLHVQILEEEDAGEAERHAARSALARLHEVRGEWGRLDRVLDDRVAVTEHPLARAALLVRLARNAELRLDDIARAASLYDEAAASGRPALLAQDRLRIARLQGDGQAAAEALEAAATSTTDPRVEAGLLRVLALYHEHGSRQAGAHEHAAAIYARLTADAPDDAQALDGLVRCAALAARAGGDASDLDLGGAVLARARRSTDEPLRALLAFAAGVLAEAGGQLPLAGTAYGVALEVDAAWPPALLALRRLHASANDWATACLLSERLAAALRDRGTATAAWLEAGLIAEQRLGDTSRALASYRALLATEPSHPDALERALALSEAAGDHRGATSLLLAHADATPDPGVRARALVRRAGLLASRLGDTAGAITDLRRVLAGGPGEGDVATMQSLAVLEERARNWQEALALHERIVRSPLADRTARRRGRLAQARIHGDELRDDARARAILEELVAERADDRDACLRLADVAGRSGHEARALELYAHLSGAGTTVDRARALLALESLLRSRPDRWPREDADAALARVFDLAIADPSALPMLEERSTSPDALRRFATQAEAAVVRYPPNTPGALPLRLALARALRDGLGDDDAADRQLAAAVHAFPESMDTRMVLAEGLRRRNDDSALDELRRGVEIDPTAPGPYEGLLAIAWSEGLLGIAGFLASAVALLGGPPQVERMGVVVNVEAAVAAAAALRARPDALAFDDAMARFVGPSRAWQVRRLLAVVDPFLPKLLPGAETRLDPRARLPDHHPLCLEVHGLAAAVGVVPPDLQRGGPSREVALLLTEPRTLVLGADVDGPGRALAVFHAAYACARMVGGGSVYAAPRRQVVALLDAMQPDVDGPVVRDLRRRLGSVLPRKTKRDLERIVAEAPGTDLHAEFSAWEEEEARRALYCAVVLSRDLRAAGGVLAEPALAIARADERRRAIAASPALREVLEFAASAPGWDAVRRVFA